MLMYTSHTRAADSDSRDEWPAPIARIIPVKNAYAMPNNASVLKLKSLLRSCRFKVTTPTMTPFGDQPHSLPSRAFNIV